VRLTRINRAGANNNSSASAPFVFVLRMLSSRQAAASHSAKTTNVSTGEMKDALSTASLWITFVRPHTGNSGKSWYASQQDNSNRAPEGRSSEAVPRAARKRCNFTRYHAPAAMPTAAPATLEATSDRLHVRESSKSWSISIDPESASASATGARTRTTRDARSLTAR